MAHRIASRRGAHNGQAAPPLCVRDKRKTRAAAVAKGSSRNGQASSGSGGRHHSEDGLQSSSSPSSSHGPGGADDASRGQGNINGAVEGPIDPSGPLPPSFPSRPAPVVIERAEIARLASQYTPCAGCSAAVKGLLQRPIEQLRLVNAVVEEVPEEEEEEGLPLDGGGGGGGHGGKSKATKGRGGAVTLAGVRAGVQERGAERDHATGEGGCAHACRHNHHHHCHHHPHHHDDSRALDIPSHVEHLCAKHSRAGGNSGRGIGGGGGGGGGCGGCGSSVSTILPRRLCLREAYLTDTARLDQLLDTFPLEALMKKVQPKGVGLRCEVHRRNGGHATADGWEWEDAWDRLPGDKRLKVAAIEVDVLEAAMHQATSTHRFCADCKHNVVTAFDILTCKCDLADIDNDDEFLPDLFWPFTGRIGPVPGDLTGQQALLSCPLEEVEELICWHEDFDSREYTRSSQRHAATLEHGQREIRSIVGSVLLAQLRTNHHNHLAQVQGEQYLFALVLHAIRTRIEGCGRGVGCAGLGGASTNGGGPWSSRFGGGPSPCPSCGGAADPGCPMCDGTGLSLAALGFVEDGDKKAKTKSKKKRERKARAKASKKCQEETDLIQAQADGSVGAGPADGAGLSANGSAGNGKGEKQCRNGKNEADTCTPRESHSKHQPRLSSTSKKREGGHGHRVEYSKLENGGGRLVKGAARNGVKDAEMRAETAKARQRAGSSGMESAGSLLSMLDDADERRWGPDGGYGDLCDGDDDGIDEDLMIEMERLRILKTRTDVQRTRAALRSNLQKNFDQLLISSIAREAGSKA